MTATGIICEYNPMHSGHIFHIERTREQNADVIVCAMSGNYVQRGEPAFTDKWSRARTAVKNGANLVADIPSPWVLDGAGTYSRAGVYILKALGCDALSFGAETSDIKMLRQVASLSSDEVVTKKVPKFMAQGCTYPLALRRAIAEIAGEESADVLSGPNNTLGIEYINAINELNAGMRVVVVRRLGARHDSPLSEGLFVSASAIRKASDLNDVSPYLAKGVLDEIKISVSKGAFPLKTETGDKAIMSVVSRLSKQEIFSFCGDESLANRIFSKTKSSANVHDLIKNIKNKSLTEAKIRRSLMRCFLELDSSCSEKTPPYINILAADRKGLEYLRCVARDCPSPIVTRHRERSELSGFAGEIYKKECFSTTQYGCFAPTFAFTGEEERHSIQIVE